MQYAASEEPFSFFEPSCTCWKFIGWGEGGVEAEQKIKEGEEDHREDHIKINRYCHTWQKRDHVEKHDIKFIEAIVDSSTEQKLKISAWDGGMFNGERFLFNTKSTYTSIQEAKESKLELIDIKKKAMIQLKKKN